MASLRQMVPQRLVSVRGDVIFSCGTHSGTILYLKMNYFRDLLKDYNPIATCQFNLVCLERFQFYIICQNPSESFSRRRMLQHHFLLQQIYVFFSKWRNDRKTPVALG